MGRWWGIGGRIRLGSVERLVGGRSPMGNIRGRDEKTNEL
jgi:hypothetical protein